MDDLALLLHKLPQELFDCIYDKVFTAPVCRIDIGDRYVPSHLLCVSSASRRQFAKSYCHNTVFVVDNDVHLHKWLRSIASATQLPLLREVRFMNRSLLDPCVWRFQARFIGPQLDMRSAVKRATFNELKRLLRNLRIDGLELPEDVLKVERYFRNGDGEEEMVIC